jgi:hydrogenase maturation protein HypF
MIRVRIRVAGIVQGVGFRPFVHGLAQGLGLSGFVGNDESGVLIEVEGDLEAVRKLLAELSDDPPPLAVVESVVSESVQVTGDSGFTIITSRSEGHRVALISPDTATCEDCLEEMRDPADRRYRYPFVNCTHCGPRFTIVTGVPYDRAATTMAGFPMCPACALEYHDPADRRFHAQPTCCPECGPSMRLLDAQGHPDRDRYPSGNTTDATTGTTQDAIVQAACALRAGAVLAVKGLGGFHLAAVATGSVGEQAVADLRGRKHREDKPFALLVPDIAAARELVELGPSSGPAEALLSSRRRPIVLLRRRYDTSYDHNKTIGSTTLATQVAPGNASLGVMLPYTPLHHLLVELVGAPIVLTSGNVSDEPIVFRDEEAIERLHGIADGFLTHDRPIHIRTDDSVYRVVSRAGSRAHVVPIRRSRGYAPEPLTLTWPATRPILGCGAELKSTFCLARGQHAFLSHHIGDLENFETLRSYTTGIEHFRELFDVRPELLVHDLHPEYLSTKYAHDQAHEHGVELLGVQHHHAHLASCLADNGVTGPVIGIACDGLGYGCDEQLWGGEVMEVSLAHFTRLAHLEPVALPGGAAAVREPWRMAASYLRACGLPPPPGLAERQGARWGRLASVLEAGVNSPPTTSTGRLFDAVAALIGIRDRVSYEGQAAIELEQLAWRAPRTCRDDPAEGHPARIDGSLLRGTDLVRGVVADLASGLATAVIAARFHTGLIGLLAGAATAARARTGLDTVALSGGVFQNGLLLTGLCQRLGALGVEVLTHSRVPPNDAGISLGQVAVAIARDQRSGVPSDS